MCIVNYLGNLSLKLHCFERTEIRMIKTFSRVHCFSHNFTSHFSLLMESYTFHIYCANRDEFNDLGDINSPLADRQIINHDFRPDQIISLVKRYIFLYSTYLVEEERCSVEFYCWAWGMNSSTCATWTDADTRILLLAIPWSRLQ